MDNKLSLIETLPLEKINHLKKDKEFRLLIQNNKFWYERFCQRIFNLPIYDPEEKYFELYLKFKDYQYITDSLYIAVLKNDSLLVYLWTFYGNLPSEEIYRSFVTAVEQNSKHLVDIFLRKDCEITPELIIKSSRLHDSSILRSFLDKDKRYVNTVYEKNEGNYYIRRSPLHEAVICNNVDNIRLLLDYGADPYEVDETGQTVLDFVIEDKNSLVLRLILAQKKFKNIEKVVQRKMAYLVDNPALLKALIDFDQDELDKKTKKDLLFTTLDRENYLSLKILLEAGFDPNWTNYLVTSLNYAIHKGLPKEFIRLIIQHGGTMLNF